VKPRTDLVIYKPKPGHEKELEALVIGHWPAIKATGLVTDEAARVWRATEKSRDPQKQEPPYFIEIFTWKDEKGPEVAHQTPAVMAVWEPMGAHLADLRIMRIDEVG
jgi:hypothetical protein